MAAVLDEVRRLFAEAGCTGTLCVEPLASGSAVELDADQPVSPASVIKVLVAQAALNACADGSLDPSAPRRLPATARTPGPVGLSLMSDDVVLSLRDLVVLMLTISDNVATDAVVEAVGLDAVNGLARRLGLSGTLMTADLRTMLDDMAVDAGFDDFAALEAYEPQGPGDPDSDEVRRRLASSAALDPTRGTRTTARDSVRLLQSIWRDEAGPGQACAEVRRRMAQQLTRHRIASGFPPGVAVAAKSGGLMGVVRNEVGVVRLPDGAAYAVAVFTRTDPGTRADPRSIDAAIGTVSARAVDLLHP
ncbi:MAG: serine hydrolase [Nocardioides sp.]